MGHLTRRHEHFIVLPALGLAYGRVPKVANSMLKRQLARAAGLQNRFDNGFSKDRDWRTKAPDAFLVTAAELARDWPDVFTFAFVREPMSRLASCFRSKVAEAKRFSESFHNEGLRPDTPFADFVRHVARRGDWRSNIHYRAQATILTRKGNVVPQFIGRFEALAEDWTRLSAEIEARGGTPLCPLPPRRQTRPIVAAENYFKGDTKLVALARQRYAEDYRLFYPELT
ncbi:MAG: sulfotransferase family 2 domain-containing protein [Pseudomonadota bacterium]